MLEYDDAVPALLAKAGMDPMSGARNLRRVIVKKVENPLSDLLLAGRLSGGKVILRTDREELLFDLCENVLASV